MRCRGCGVFIEDDIGGFSWHSYWHSVKIVYCTKECKDLHYPVDVQTCQTIDADCNDCGNFKRDRHLSSGISIGVCLLKEVVVRGYPNFASGHPCFIHRRKVVNSFKVSQNG